MAQVSTITLYLSSSISPRSLIEVSANNDSPCRDIPHMRMLNREAMEPTRAGLDLCLDTELRTNAIPSYGNSGPDTGLPLEHCYKPEVWSVHLLISSLPFNASLFREEWVVTCIHIRLHLFPIFPISVVFDLGISKSDVTTLTCLSWTLLWYLASFPGKQLPFLFPSLVAS